MTNAKNENYKENPEQFICLGEEFNSTFMIPSYIKSLDLCIQVLLIGNDDLYYLDLESSRMSTENVRQLELLSDEDRKKVLDQEFVGGGCH